MEITVGVLTISDRCHRKEAVDESGPNLIKLIGEGIIEHGSVVQTALVPDSKEDIEEVLKEWSDAGVHLVLTTGGTGVAERDVTPEATMTVLEKVVPGISFLMFKHSSEITPLAALSRGVAGVRGTCLIINLPGSKKGAQECLEAVAPVIPHAVALIHGNAVAVNRIHAPEEKKSRVVVGGVASRKRESAYPCIDVADAQRIIMDRIHLLKKEKVVSYEQAHGYVLAEDVVARDNLPPFDASMKDGYAVLSSDKMLERNVIAVSHAGGELGDAEVFTGHCVRVSTGAVIPCGADAVVQVEDTKVTLSGNSEEEISITLNKLPTAGQDIRKKGSDFHMGELLLANGTYLDPSAVGVIAAAGVASVRVFDRPLVAVLSTGNELLAPHENLSPGKVRDSNRVTLLSLLEEEHFRVVDLGIALDNPDALRDALERGFRVADVVVTTGSMSMGERDYLKEVLMCDFGAEICFGRVKVKPGKPTAFTLFFFEGKPKIWFGLPGNPASALVTSHLFLLPALRKVSGFQKVFPISVRAQMQAQPTLYAEDRPHYVRALLTYNYRKGDWEAEVIGDQRSSRIGSCVNANSLVRIPPHSEQQRNAFSSGIPPHSEQQLNGKYSSGRGSYEVSALLIGKSFSLRA